jgi:hypothetical protein
MAYEVQPLPFKPQRLDGLSDGLPVSHYENNYGGAGRRLNAIEPRLEQSGLDGAPCVRAQRHRARAPDCDELDDPARGLL